MKRSSKVTVMSAQFLLGVLAFVTINGCGTNEPVAAPAQGETPDQSTCEHELVCWALVEVLDNNFASPIGAELWNYSDNAELLALLEDHYRLLQVPQCETRVDTCRNNVSVLSDLIDRINSAVAEVELEVGLRYAEAIPAHEQVLASVDRPWREHLVACANLREAILPLERLDADMFDIIRDTPVVVGQSEADSCCPEISMPLGAYSSRLLGPHWRRLVRTGNVFGLYDA